MRRRAPRTLRALTRTHADFRPSSLPDFRPPRTNSHFHATHARPNHPSLLFQMSSSDTARGARSFCVSGLRLRGGLPDDELAAQAAKIGKVAVTLTVTVPHIRCVSRARTHRRARAHTHTHIVILAITVPHVSCVSRTHARTHAPKRAHTHTHIHIVALAVTMPHVRCVSRTNTHTHIFLLWPSPCPTVCV